MKGESNYDTKKKVKKIVVKKGITSIPAKVFAKLSKVQEITVANSVKSIDNEAFADCYRLKNITMPGKFKRLNARKKREPIEMTTVDTVSFNSPLDIKIARCIETKAYVVSSADSKYKSIDGSIYTKNGRRLYHHDRLGICKISETG